jgi:hypothetical protein
MDLQKAATSCLGFELQGKKEDQMKMICIVEAQEHAKDEHMSMKSDRKT